MEAARSFARSKIEELTKGTAHVGSLTPKQIAVVTDAVDFSQGHQHFLFRELSGNTSRHLHKILGQQPLIMDRREALRETL